MNISSFPLGWLMVICSCEDLIDPNTQKPPGEKIPTVEGAEGRGLPDRCSKGAG